MDNQISELIHHRRKQLKMDQEYFKRSKLLTDHQQKQITQELEELRKLEISNRGYRL